MKIAFLCSSLEPGRDGVGDYVRRLAGELIRQGHYVVVVALNDYYVDKEQIGIQATEEVNILTMRLPAIWSAKQRFVRAKEWIDEFDPKWLSLQFVLFGFHPKGLPLGISRWLADLGKGRCWHIMFHELWVGIAIEPSMKLTIWGWVQKKIIQSLFIRLRPTIIHTQTSVYQTHLAKLGVEAHLLPLFSNIPETKNSVGSKQDTEIKNKQIDLVIFGTIHPNAPIEQFSKEVAAYASQNNSKVMLTIIGRSGSEQDHWASVWESKGLMVELLGEQAPECISGVLNRASLGISTTPMPIVEKSGSVAAMLSHGLPVLCVSEILPLQPVDEFNLSTEIVEYLNGNFESYANLPRHKSRKNSLSDVSHQFVNSLHVCI